MHALLHNLQLPTAVINTSLFDAMDVTMSLFLGCITKFENKSTVVKASHIIGVGATKVVSLIGKTIILPAYGSSTPLHTSTLIDEHSI